MATTNCNNMSVRYGVAREVAARRLLLAVAAALPCALLRRRSAALLERHQHQPQALVLVPQARVVVLQLVAVLRLLRPAARRRFPTPLPYRRRFRQELLRGPPCDTMKRRRMPSIGTASY